MVCSVMEREKAPFKNVDTDEGAFEGLCEEVRLCCVLLQLVLLLLPVIIITYLLVLV